MQNVSEKGSLRTNGMRLERKHSKRKPVNLKRRKNIK
jgi:hypothetical protein